MNTYSLSKSATLALFVLITAGLTLPLLSHAQILPNCDPTGSLRDVEETESVDGQSGFSGCGLAAFAELINRAIRWLVLISIPLGVLAIGWGGVLIVFSAGDQGKYKKGIEAIKITVMGFAILLLAWIIVKGIFIGLGVQSNFTPTGLQ